LNERDRSGSISGGLPLLAPLAGASGIATGQQIDDLVGDLRAAKGGGYEWVSMPFFLDLVSRKPVPANK
jgi:hypothetical protein